MNVKRPPHVAALFFALGLALPALSQQPNPEFISFDAAQPILRAYSDSLPPELRDSPTPAAWSSWIKAHDAEIRERLVRGEEDTLTNLLRWGVTFTSEYQISREYL